MLYLTRKVGESVVINDDIEVTVQKEVDATREGRLGKRAF